MRYVTLAATIATLALSAPASAQRTSVPQVRMPGGEWRPGTAPRRDYRGEGRWQGGVRAPGGWSAYRRPVRGWVLPGYWVSPRFHVVDYRAYGLLPPLPGYRWTRYYDDAVIVDETGRVRDTISGVDWDARPLREAHHGADYDAPPIDHRDTQIVHTSRPSTTVVRGPGTVTTITVVPAVTTTTTTTEYVYERAPTLRHVFRRGWKPTKIVERACTEVCR